MQPPSIQSHTSAAISVELYSTGWQTALTRPPKIRVESWSPSNLRPDCIRLQPKQPKKPRVLSIAFPDVGWKLMKDATEDGVAKPRATQSPLAASHDVASANKKPSTRIRPPRDAIKLEDRLYYLLQPPLESLFSSGSLQFPFQPFPYQYAGIAFLYARHSAILADEMGLGKTMQAITTIRLLLHAGELRRVLLICPKPLVTNWQREFGLWAPELPVTVIEGDGARRQWQWRLPDAPVKIANYELLMRDRDSITDETMHFDLVVLDEAQRIKNRSPLPPWD